MLDTEHYLLQYMIHRLYRRNNTKSTEQDQIPISINSADSIQYIRFKVTQSVINKCNVNTQTSILKILYTT